MTTQSQALDEFAREARAFRRWVTGDEPAPMDAPTALRRVAALFSAALALPATDALDVSEEEEPDVPAEELARVAERTKLLPFSYYLQVLDPHDFFLAPPPDPDKFEEPGVADLLDDIRDIHRDVACGLILFDAGSRVDAHWHWAFSFRAHWGRHAASAIHALQAYVTR
ncbi:MAG: DUF5063 domain-containing protein [Planctomycetaceae bacterium]|nr:DUF5063 domain-containing protein [Planctomycetaceae bacterium]